jgi:ligand-binding sensor domain-containing protein
LYVANDNSVWVAGEKGIARFDPVSEKWTSYHHTTDNFTAIDQAKDGSLWIGTWDDGIRHLILATNGSNDIWETYTSEDGLVSDNISDIKLAPDGTIWFATAKGLSHCAFDSKR